MSAIAERVPLVNAAGAELRATVEKVSMSGLTYAEILYLLTDVAHSYASDALEQERGPK